MGGGGGGVCGRFGSFRDSFPEIFVVKPFTYGDLNLDRKLFRLGGKIGKHRKHGLFAVLGTVHKTCTIQSVSAMLDKPLVLT